MTTRAAFTPSMLNNLRSVRAQQQEVIWDGKEDGLCVLRSRGPKHKGQSTLTFRVAYYLPSREMSRCLLNIAKRSLLRLMLSCVGLASKHAAG